jgi:hypothetical protein
MQITALMVTSEDNQAAEILVSMGGDRRTTTTNIPPPTHATRRRNKWMIYTPASIALYGTRRASRRRVSSQTHSDNSP